MVSMYNESTCNDRGTCTIRGIRVLSGRVALKKYKTRLVLVHQWSESGGSSGVEAEIGILYSNF